MKRFFFLAVLLTAGTARADERPVELKDAPGREVVENNCGACHSLDYIRMNSSFLSAAAWRSEVKKMIETYGAPVGEADAAAITAYLIANYGGSPEATGTAPATARQGR